MRIGAYELLDVIGSGGMGTVHRAVVCATGQPVAVKLMAEKLANDKKLLRRFRQEYEAARQFEHPHIVRALDFGMAHGQPYLVMEFIQGQTLWRLVVERGRLALALAVRLTVQLAEALTLIHSKNLIHRDVKPDNILLTTDGQPKLGDLGLVKNLLGDPGLTRSGLCLGTVDYMAPEQFGDAKNVDARCDVYGLAATLYFALTAARPFQGRSALAVLNKKLRNEFVLPRRLVPTLPEGVEAAIRSALDAKQQRRPESCAAFAELLLACVPEALQHDTTAAFLPAGCAEPDTRKADRSPSRLGVHCQLMQGGTCFRSAKVRDVSPLSVCLELDRRFEPPALLTVEVRDEAGEPFTFIVRVRWVRQVAPRRWQLGCEFGRPLGESDRLALLTHQSATLIGTEPQ